MKTTERKLRICAAALCAALTIGLAGCSDSKTSDTFEVSVYSSGSKLNSGAAQGGTDIGLDGAKAAALKHAGLSESAVTFVKTGLDRDNGVAEYDIEFTADAMKYEYEINAADGTVLKFSSESIQPPAPVQSDASVGTTEITLDEAKAIALKHAGLSESAVTFVKTKLDSDNGVAEYDIEFTSGEKRYEYEIMVSSGDIKEYSVEAITSPNTPPAQSSQPPQSSTEQSPPQQTEPPAPSAPSGRISEAEAKKIAANHAGFTEAQVTFIKSKLDYDDGGAEYDIEFTVNSTKYEYEIRESDGAVLEYSTETISAPAQSGSSARITEERAKEIAVQHAGFTADQVKFVKAELDYDDGIAEYEIEFRVNGREYEIKINADSGAVLEMEVDD